MFRLLVAFLLFCTSLLAVFRAPEYHLWMLSVVVTERGYWFALGCLAVWLPGWRRTTRGRYSAGLALAAFCLFLSPLSRAWFDSRDLGGELQRRFGNTKPRPPFRTQPLDLPALIEGVPVPPARRTTFAYSGNLQLDLYQSVHRYPPSPCIVVIHGGSWRSGSNQELTDLNSYLAGQGYVVAAINYRLAPRSKHPAQETDVRKAIAFLKHRAREFGIDPGRIVLLGRSAGGQIALSVGYRKRDPSIRGIVAFYAPADLIFAYTNPGNPLILDTHGILKDYLGDSPAKQPDLYREASPIFAVDEKTPATLLIHGDRDELVWVRQSERLSATLHRAGRPYYFLRLPWATHSCDYFFDGPCGQITTFAVERFIAAVTRPD